MSILLDPPLLTRRAPPGKAAWWVGLTFVGFFLFLAYGVVPLIHQLSLTDPKPGWGAWISRDPVAAYQRITLFLLLIVSLTLAKKMGWAGLRDVGWSSAQTRGERKKDFLLWAVLGSVLSGLMGGLAIYRGQSPWMPSTLGGWMMWVFLDVLFFGMLKILFLETWLRGILFRTFTEAWSSWVAGGILSLGIAGCTLSLQIPQPLSGTGGATLRTLLFSPFRDVSTFLLFLSLFALHMMFCRLVRHKGDIWAATGLHASLYLGLTRFASTLQQSETSTEVVHENGFVFFSRTSPAFLLGILLFWGWMEWHHRKKLTSYGRVHF